MSAASDYGVLVVEKLIIPPLDADGRNVFAENNCVTAVGDVIAYLLHWLWDQGEHEIWIDQAIAAGRFHFEAERGLGDEMSDEFFYAELIERLQ